ncbi:MAG: pyrroline-5-carboxylate reductase [Cellvibrionaceae bacterium]|nr:pyrroline-5-carboxylate reductase [Cellvibrionaceae bacterium]
MARSIAGGLINSGINAQNIAASDPDAKRREDLQNTLGIRAEQDNAAVAGDCDILVIAVKPQVMASVCQALSSALNRSPLVISIAAGIDCRSLNTWLDHRAAVVRCMPNTPALIGEGASALFATAEVSAAQCKLAEQTIRAVGSVCWVEHESQLDAVTAVSGSGPAYFFLVLEAMTEAGVKLGLEKQTAADLAIQTAFGAAKLARESDLDLAQLRRAVTSPKGTTESAIASFEKHQIRHIFMEAMQDCAARSRELCLELGAKSTL